MAKLNQVPRNCQGAGPVGTGKTTAIAVTYVHGTFPHIPGQVRGAVITGSRRERERRRAQRQEDGDNEESRSWYHHEFS